MKKAGNLKRFHSTLISQDPQALEKKISRKNEVFHAEIHKRQNDIQTFTGSPLDKIHILWYHAQKFQHPLFIFKLKQETNTSVFIYKDFRCEEREDGIVILKYLGKGPSAE